MKQIKKYKLIKEDKKIFLGKTLFRIKALVDLRWCKKGDLGGWIEKEKNLSQKGDSWVSDNSRVFDNAVISDNSWIYDNAEISGDSRISDNSRVFDNAVISGDSRISDNAEISGDSRISDNSRIFGNSRISGDSRIFGNAEISDNYRVSRRFNLKGDIDFELPMINIDTKTKLNKLKKFLDNFD